MTSSPDDISQEKQHATGLCDQVRGVMDRHAFAREYQRIYRRLWLLAAGMLGNASDADDIVQQAALTAFGRIHEFREGSSFTAWLCEIVKRTAWNACRKTARRKTFAADPVELEQQPDRRPTHETSAVDGLSAIASEFDDDLLRVLNQMPEEPRCCLLLRVIDGLSYAEISEMLGIPANTAASHVHRGKSFARERLWSNSPTHGGPTDVDGAR